MGSAGAARVHLASERLDPGEVTEVAIAFTAEGDGTRVTLRHRGFARIAGDVGCEVGYAAGWRELLGRYQD